MHTVFQVSALYSILHYYKNDSKKNTFTMYEIFYFLNKRLLCCRTCLMFLPSTASFVSSLFFAVHPIHTEAVCIIENILYKLIIIHHI